MAQRGRGGRKGPLSDTPREGRITVPLVLFLAFLGVIFFYVYDVDWGGVGDFVRGYWYIVLIVLVAVVLIYRAYQGVTTGDNMRSVKVGGGGGGGGGGGTSSWMFIIKGVIIIVVLWLILQILNWFGMLGSSISDFANGLNPFDWFKMLSWSVELGTTGIATALGV